MKIPENRTTRDVIFKAWEGTNDGGLRNHLGASLIGDKCERKLWYTFRWATYQIHEGRLLKLFDRGHLEEFRFIRDLEMIGCKVFGEDPEVPKDRPANERQWRFEALGGHFGGGCDAIIPSGVPEAPKSPHIGEFKTSNEKGFKEVCSKGVKEGKPLHYAQMQLYMGLSKMRWGSKGHIKRALYLIVNKNNDDLYSERVKFDKNFFDELMEKGKTIVFSTSPPKKLSEDPKWYECKSCDHYDVCHMGKLPYPSCRSCVWSTPENNGSWSCKKHFKMLTREDQLKGCEHHMIIPPIIESGYKAIEADDNRIVFEKRGTTDTWVNGSNNMTTSNAFKLQVDGNDQMIVNGKVQDVIETFGGSVEPSNESWRKF